MYQNVYLYHMKAIFKAGYLWQHLIFWILMMSIHYFMIIRFFEPNIAMIRGFVNIIPIATLFYVNGWLINRYFEQGKYLKFGLTIVLILLLITLLRVRINLVFPQLDLAASLLNNTYTWTISVIATNLIVVLLSCVYQILQNRNENEKIRLAWESEQKEAQIQFLKAQINPHFLFNTLNNIYSLAVVKSDKTPATILRLSDLLRYVIYESKDKAVPLRGEISHIQQFIDLFRVRFEEEMDIRFEIRGEPADVKIEPMILIPLVENSFKHCDFDTNPAAYAHFSLEIKGDHLVFTTQNTVNTINRQKDKVGGVGLSNINKRLSLKYPEAFQFKTTSTENTFEVYLKFPVEV